MAIDMLMFDFREPERLYFQEHDFDCFNIKFFEESLSMELLDKIPAGILDNVSVISVFINSPVTEEVIKRFKNLRIIATRSTGVDHIDLDFCRKRHIAVTNVENYGATAVAQYTFALMLSLVRKVIPANLYMRENNRNINMFLGRDLNGITLGVVGTGAIGGSVCKIAHCLGMKILAFDVHPKEELIVKYGVRYADFEELLKEADVITLHLPYTKENHNMLARSQFEKMYRKPYIINTSRGELINLQDLKEALLNGLIAGVGLDVLSCESMSFRREEYCQLLGMSHAECFDELKIVNEIIKWDNVIITPHIAYETQEAVDYILQTSMVSVTDFFKGANTCRVV